MADIHEVDNLQIVSYLSPSAVAEELATQYDDDTLASFIEELDQRVACWNFTEKAYKYFKKQHKLYKAEVKDV